MKKEVLLAIFAGTIAGLILAFGAWRLTSKFKNKENTTDVSSPSPATQVDAYFSLAISSNQDFDVVTNSPTEISGLTQSGAYIVSLGSTKDYFTSADKDGVFNLKTDLDAGLNFVNFYAFDGNGSFKKSELNLIYSSEFEKYLKNSDSQNASDSAESVRDKIKNSLYKPTAYVGTITDLTDTTLQIKSDGNGILQASIGPDTSYVSDEDLAIGDFVIAMGFVDGDSVLEAKRIMVTDQPEKSQKVALWSEVLSIDGKEVIIKNENGDEISIDFPKNWQGPDIKDLEVGTNYIFTGTLSNSTLSLRSIFEVE